MASKEISQDEFILGLNKAHGEKLKLIAREAIRSHILGTLDVNAAEDPALMHKGGVFVTIREHGELRGCIGHIYPKDTLENTTKIAAVQAAVDDPRFPPLRSSELEDIEVEVTVLGDFIELDTSNPQNIEEIELGRDGLMVSDRYHSGLLLPQVAIEFHLSKRQFLDETCLKAGLPKDAWKSRNVHVYKFTGRVFG